MSEEMKNDALALPNAELGRELVKAATKVRQRKEEDLIVAKVTRFLQCLRDAENTILRGQQMQLVYQRKIAAIEAGEFEIKDFPSLDLVFTDPELNKDY